MTVQTIDATAAAAQLEEVAGRRGWRWFTADHDVNLWVIRNAADDTNLFDDALVLVWTEGGARHLVRVRCTADPGKASLLDPMNKAGCARLCVAQNRQSHQLGKHKGRDALRQVAPVRYQRDNTRTGIHHATGPVLSGVIFADIHDAPGEANGLVDKDSEGCIVTRWEQGLTRVLDVIRQQAAAGLGDKVTLTLVDAGEEPQLAYLLDGMP